MQKDVLPSDRPALRDKAADAYKAIQQEQRDRLQGAMRRTFETPDGLIVLKWLREECGANIPILGATNGAIDEKATLYQAMRLNLWIKIRRMLSFNILKEVEYEPDQI